MPNFIRARLCGSFCTFMGKKRLDHNASPAGRVAAGDNGKTGVHAPSSRAMEIEEARWFHKDIRVCHACDAHLLREPPVCYTCVDRSLDQLSVRNWLRPLSPGGFGAAGRNSMKDEGREAGGL